MPPIFTKKRRWPPSKPVQYTLACIAVVAALSLLIGWLVIGFGENNSNTNHTNENDDPSAVLPGTSYCMVIIKDAGYERFALVETIPNKDAITVIGISPVAEINGNTLASILQKQGPAGATTAVSHLMQLPVQHYVSLSIADAEDLFTKLGENLTFALGEDVTYVDENGAAVNLKADTLHLTPKHVTALLKHQDWLNSARYDSLVAALTAATLNQHLADGRSLKGYFELITNTATTDLRIDHFNAYLSGLEHLASVNDGSLATFTTYQ